jgi:heterodisulfide reductase subunit C
MAIDHAVHEQALDAKESARMRMWLRICASCGLCAKACHFFASDPRPEHVPAFRLKPLARVFAMERVDQWTLDWLRDVDYGTCTMCQRCAMYCPFGINIAYLVRQARGILVAQGQVPKGMAAGMANSLEHGNNLAIDQEEYVETIDWQLEELADEMPEAVARVDVEGARTMVTFHPRDIKYQPQNLYSYLKIYNAAGEDYTFPTTGWDSTNIGLFAGDDATAATMSARVVDAAKRLKVARVCTAE